MVDKNDNSDDPLMREVNEELRREQMEKLWQKYQNVILGGAALVIATVGGYKWLEARNLSAIDKSGAAFNAAQSLVSQGKTDEATKALEALATSSSGGYAALARLQTAANHVKAGKTDDAAAVYDTLAKDSAVDPTFQGYAQMQSALLRLDKADFTEMQNRLTPLLGDTSPWRFNARELLGLSAQKAGKPDEAKKILEPLIGDLQAPRSIVERAKMVLGNIVAAELGQQAGSATKPAEPAVTPAASEAKPAGGEPGGEKK
jgi:hypothetical protein